MNCPRISLPARPISSSLQLSYRAALFRVFKCASSTTIVPRRFPRSALWLFFRSVQPIIYTRLRHQISRVFNAFLSILFTIQVPHTHTTLTCVLISLFSMSTLIFMRVNNIVFSTEFSLRQSYTLSNSSGVLTVCCGRSCWIREFFNSIRSVFI